ncbi:MAG: sigma-54 dependent transcriptional regulator [Pseudomonadota bacterium]|nr:sigma-54 dependent transcriptional regulator [Pseudomonadota bacterium]
MAATALLVTDDGATRDKIATIFEFIDYALATSDSASATAEALQSGADFVIALIALDDSARLGETIAQINKLQPSLPVYVVREESENAPTQLKGVSGFLAWPLRYRTLLGIIRNAEQEGRRGVLAGTAPSVSLTGNSPQLKEVQALIRHVAMTDANVLLLGESGTGKEVVARAIHHLSLRTDQPFVAVNCGAIPPELLESELFGHEKGAFTGAISTRKGRFELAEGGTLFLDEIGDMPLPMQVKLLRVLQERCYERVGGTKTMQSNVRLIAATHQDLEKKIGEGKFRMDLFYRLNVFPIELPPLRDRVGDIPLLIREFATRMELEHRSPIVFDESAITALRNHPLPGNVRELENLVERLAILFPGETITNQKLPLRYQSETLIGIPAAAAGAAMAWQAPQAALASAAVASEAAPSMPVVDLQDGMDLKEYLTSLEKSIIEKALEQSDWIVAKAAKALSLQRTTLVEKIKKLDIQNTVA